MIRAFIAVELDEPLRRELAAVQQQLKERIARGAAGARVAWVRPASMHLTLKFLGDIEERRADAFRAMMADVARASRPFAIPLARLGAFPRLQEPRALWAGPPEGWEHGEDARRLAALARAIDERCAREGVPPESRPFAPHLTLARIKAGEREAGRALAAAGALDRPLVVGPLAVRAFALMRSRLDSHGAVHTRLWDLPLGAVS